MLPSRQILAATIILGVGSSHALVVLKDREYWPVSQYPMYSWVETGGWHLSTLRLMGVPEGGGTEFSIPHDGYLPFDQSRLFDGLAMILREPDGEERAREALNDVFLRYESRRQQGEHHAPKLSAMRLYDATYDLKLDAANVDRPEARRLLMVIQ